MTWPISSTRLTTLTLALVGAATLAGCGDDMEAREAMDYDESVDEAAAEVADAQMEAIEADAPDSLEISEDFSAVDLNGDSQLDMDEVTDWAQRTGFSYRTWSENGDSTPKAFYGTLFARFDGDADGTVTRMEWSRHAPLFPSDILTESDFTRWDEDGNGELRRSEVVAGFESTDLYASIDSDGSSSIEDAELIEWFYDLVDTNDDGVIDATEWSDAQAYHRSMEM
jgi:Ca2+-binding EF-hand superfamily protein